jgi:hypothetical protein
MYISENISYYGNDNLMINGFIDCAGEEDLLHYWHEVLNNVSVIYDNDELNLQGALCY